MTGNVSEQTCIKRLVKQVCFKRYVKSRQSWRGDNERQWAIFIHRRRAAPCCKHDHRSCVDSDAQVV